MLAFQIAAGIVLAAVVLRFWRQILRGAGVGVAVLAGVVLASVGLPWLSGTAAARSTNPWPIFVLTGLWWGWLIYAAIRERNAKKRPIIRDGPPP